MIDKENAICMIIELYAAMAQAEIEKKEKHQREGIDAKKNRGEWMTNRKNTIQKDLVRNAVYEMKRHVTANEVYEFIKEAYPTIGKGGISISLKHLKSVPEVQMVFIILHKVPMHTFL